jgi:hypothetical protein
MIVFGAFIGKATPTQVSAAAVHQMLHIISLRLHASCPDDSLRSAGLYGSAG